MTRPCGLSISWRELKAVYSFRLDPNHFYSSSSLSLFACAKSNQKHTGNDVQPIAGRPRLGFCAAVVNCSGALMP